MAMPASAGILGSAGNMLIRSPAVGLLLHGVPGSLLARGASALLGTGAATGNSTVTARMHHDDDAIPSFDDKYMKDVKQAIKTRDRMSQEAAASMLSERLGMAIRPGDVVPLAPSQIYSLLREAANATGENDGTAAALGSNIAHNKISEAMFSHAEGVSTRFFGDEVYQRGIVEFSNVCENDCGYCGIRKYQKVPRYSMTKDQMINVAMKALNFNMGTLMLQSGELRTAQRFRFIKEVVHDIRTQTIAADLARKGSSLNAENVSIHSEGVGLCVAVSAGQMPLENLLQLKEAGAFRYLLRIETSNPKLFARIHPEDQTFESRVECLQNIKASGLQLGTGIMVGLPGQTLEDLANDLVFFREVDADMIGMGPYIPEPNTWVHDDFHRTNPGIDIKNHLSEMMHLTTLMNALARITLGNVNIAATTSLQAINPMGRELALTRGANVVMPILTPTEERVNYQLYPGKPCVSHAAEGCVNCLKLRIQSVGKNLKADGSWTDPPHFKNPAVPMAHAPGSTFSGRAQGTSKPIGMQLTRAFSTSSSQTQKVPGGSDTQRINIGIFGRMNAGKSTLVNAITRQETSIVDSTPGTTADTKIALMEFHEVGPVKIFDTAGVDELGVLGSKKVKKAMAALKESDVAVVVIDATALLAEDTDMAQALRNEIEIISQAKRYGSMPMIVLNHKGKGLPSTIEKRILSALSSDEGLLSLVTELHSADVTNKITNFLQTGISTARKLATVPAIPTQYLSEDAVVFLNIPMDAETPSMRLLRPQALVQEEAIRHFATTIAYRMNLNYARSSNPKEVEHERQRFMRALKPVLEHPGPKLIVTDSQAVDILHPWTLKEGTNEPLIPFTTFSIAMINRLSGGRLSTFMEGIAALDSLKEGDRVLVAEACNHNRITDNCNDIGMVQIPKALQKLTGGKGPVIEHAFGREYPEIEEGSGGLRKFKLALHCGACMIDQQKLRARMLDMEEASVPVINYGVFLSYIHSRHALHRAIEPWNVSA